MILQEIHLISPNTTLDPDTQTERGLYVTVPNLSAADNY